MSGGGVQWPHMQDVHVTRAECHIVQVCIAHAVHSDMLLLTYQCSICCTLSDACVVPPDGCAYC